jgi:membrane protease subunit HflC
MTRPRRLVALTVAIALCLAILARCWYVVDETEYVLLSEFGRVLDVLGDDPSEIGPHGKWPWRSTIAVDRRLRVAEPPAREVLTGDRRNLEVAPYVVWQVADPLVFHRAAGGPEAASARLEERVVAAVSDALSQTSFDALASTDPAVWRLDELTGSIRDGLREPLRRDLGIDLVDVRLKRFNHPLEVRPAVFDLIRSERKEVASRLRAEGEAEYQTLTSRADRDRDERLGRAEADAERIRAEGEAEATRLLNDAHALDPKFYELVRTLDTYRAILDDRATVILSTSSPLLRLLRDGPETGPSEPNPASAARDSISSPEARP